MLRHRILTGALALGLGAIAIAATQPFFRQAPQATEHHARLKHSVGEWEGTMSMMMGGAETDFPCTESVQAIGDLWITSSFHCDFGGLPFEGASTTGFDPKKGKYIGSWIDNMTPSMTIMEGEWDAERNAMVMTYEAPDMESGEMVTNQMVSESSREANISTFYKMVDGEPVQTMKISMRRASSDKPAEAAAERDR